MIFLFQRILTHYQLPIYEKLNARLEDGLVLIHGQQPEGAAFFTAEKSELPFRTVPVKNTWIRGETAVWQNFMTPFLRCGRPEAVIMEQSPRILSLLPLFIYCRIRRIPFILWGHGGSMQRNVSNSRNIKDMLHRFLIKKADAFIAYTDGIKKELSGVTSAGKIFVARNTLDTDALFGIRANLEKEGRESVKRKLGLEREHYICFIGRLLAEKGADYLMDVYERVKKEAPDSGLLIVGDGPEEKLLKNLVKERDLEDVYFLGGTADWEKSGEYLFISDVMVMPGYVGLSVNHAFCFGLPVITQARGENGPFHSPEIEYIADRETGFICPNGNKEEMSRAVLKVFHDSESFNRRVTEYCYNNLTIDIMVTGVLKAVDFVLNNYRNSVMGAAQ